MDHVGVLLGSFVLLGLTVDGVLRKVTKPARKFPWCKTCGKNMDAAGLPKLVPGELGRYLDMYGLPTDVASRYICPNRHYQLWFVPKLGNTEQPFLLREGL
jgi:hypothetical protein